MASLISRLTDLATRIGVEIKADRASIALKAPLDSPALTGVPTAPTAASGDNSTQVATTAFVAAAAYAPLASPTFTGVPRSVNPPGGQNDTMIATTLWVNNALSLKAPLASPALSGTPTAPTASNLTNSTQIATTAFVNANAANAYAGKSSSGSPGWYQRLASLDGTGSSAGASVTLLVAGLGDYGSADRYTALVHVGQRGSGSSSYSGKVTYLGKGGSGGPTFYVVNTGTYSFDLYFHGGNFQFAPQVTVLDAQNATMKMDTATQTQPTGAVALAQVADLEFIAGDYASLASPAFSGTPTAPTPVASASDTRIATTAWVNSALAAQNNDGNSILTTTFSTAQTTPNATDRRVVVVDPSGRLGNLAPTATLFMQQAYSDVITTRAVFTSASGHMGTSASTKKFKNLSRIVQWDDDQLRKWLGLPIWEFTYKPEVLADPAEEGVVHHGVVAEQVEIRGFERLLYREDREDHPDFGKIRGFAYEKMGVYNHLALRAHNRQIEALTARIESLESRIATLAA